MSNHPAEKPLSKTPSCTPQERPILDYLQRTLYLRDFARTKKYEPPLQCDSLSVAFRKRLQVYDDVKAVQDLRLCSDTLRLC
jgi:hypothetical protein